ncbi:MAG: cytochrome c biogenesis protein CcsA [Planctomycetales bacterium]|nr:cytochrome c biogenesis protein CcsA [Planctomycetales bacterium]
MLELLPLEKQVFWGIVILSAVSSALAYRQIARDDARVRHLLTAMASLQVTLGAVLLILRAVAIRAFPLTGIFESVLILMVFIGMTFLFLSAFMQQVWFSAGMTWVLFIIVLLAAVVAKPAAVLQEAARTPWVIVHALSMTLAGAMIVFAAAMSLLFLWSRNRLKSRQFLPLLGKMPTIEKLEALNLLGLRLSFVTLTFGLVSGIGLVAVKSAGLGMTLGDWLADSKVVLIAVAWVGLLALLVLHHRLVFSGKTAAQAALVLCFLILFAFIGSRIFCKSSHDFEKESPALHSQVESCNADYTDWH